MRTTGGHRLKRFTRAAKRKQPIEAIDVGFFKTAAYDNGTPVATVAMAHNFGVPERSLPERPFFTQAIDRAKPMLRQVLRAGLDSRTMKVDRRLAGLLGQTMQDQIKLQIKALKEPDLAESTKARRKGGPPYNPLIDTGHMRNSVSHRIKRFGDSDD